MLLLRRLLCALVFAGILGGAGSAAFAASWHLSENGGRPIISAQDCAPMSGERSVLCDEECARPSSSEAMDCGPCEGVHACVAVLIAAPLVSAVEISRPGTAGVPHQAAGISLPPPFSPPRAFS